MRGVEHLNHHSRVWFVNRFFYPDESATSQILTDVANHLAAKGLSVHVLTSRLNYSTGEKAYQPREDAGGVSLIRVNTTSFGRGHLLGRAIDYLSFYLSAFFAALKHWRSGDVCVVKTDPPLLSIPMSLAARLKGAAYVNWLQDVYPDVAEKAGVRVAKGPLGWILKGMRNRSWRGALKNIAIGKRMGDYLERSGVDRRQISVIHNFVDDDAIQPIPFRTSPVRSEWGFSPDDFVIVYSGNLGFAHDYATLVEAASVLSDCPRIKFVFVGGGALRRMLEQDARVKTLSNLSFQPYQSRERLGQSLGAADLHWFSLKPDMEGLILPSKLYGIAAAGRGALFIGDPQGEAAELINTHDWGYAFDIGDGQALADKIRYLADNRDIAKRLGGNARVFADKKASKRLALRAWEGLLQKLIGETEA